MTIVSRKLEIEGSDGRPIRCDLRRPDGEGPYPVVVILHGFKGFKDWGMFPPTAERFARDGLATIALNTSHNGVGPGGLDFDELEMFARNTAGREAFDVGKVLDAIDDGTDPALDASRVALLGHSRGGGVVLLVASNDARVKCVVTWSAVARFDRWTERAKNEWRENGRLDIPNLRTGQIMWMDREVLEDLETQDSAYDLSAAAGRIRVPVLTVHGERDEAVAVEEAMEISMSIAAYEKEVLVIPATGHTFGAVHPWEGPTPAWERVVEASSEWLRRYLTDDGATGSPDPGPATPS